MSTLINASIDLSKVDKSQLKDGKYLSVQISVNDKVDNYNNNVAITVAQSKEQREAKEPKKYLGNGRVTWTDGNVVKAEYVEKTEAKPNADSLPF